MIREENHEKVGRTQRKAFLVLLTIFACAVLGFCLYALLFTQVFVPSGLIPLEVDRTMRRAELLGELQQTGTESVLVFGSSVVLEGVDASIIEEILPGEVPVYNIAESSAGLRNLMLNMPLLCQAKPSLLVCCLRRSQLHENSLPELPNELLIGYAYADYVDTSNQQPSWIYERLSEEERDSLPGTSIEKLLASRIFLLRSFEIALRHRARPDLRMEGFASNFVDPWRYTRQIPSDRLEMFVEQSRKSFAKLRYDPDSPITDVLKACLKESKKSGVRFLLVITPENPRIQEVIPPTIQRDFDASVRSVCTKYGANTYVMDATLFTTSDFLDHSHVNDSGREIFSHALADELVRLLKD